MKVLYLTLILTSVSFGAESKMFELIRKINVDHMGVVGQIDGCEFSKDNHFIIASDNHATAKIYLRETGEYVNQVKHIQMNNTKFQKAGKMNAVGYSFDRKYFYTGINDEGLKVWDAENYTLAHHFAPGKSVDCADFSPDNKWLATAADSEVWIYSLPSFEKVHTYSHDLGEVNNLDFSRDGRYLVSCAGHGKKGDIRLINVSDWSVAHRGFIGGSAKRIFFSPDAKLYAVGSRGQLCRVVDTETGATVKDLIHRGNVLSLPGDDPDENAAIEALNWSADGNYLFTGSIIDGIMRIWRRADWSWVGNLVGQSTDRQIEYIDVSSDNEVIIGGDEGVLYHFQFNPPPILEAFVSSTEGSSLISIEAEHYDSNLPLGGTAWESQTLGSASGNITMKALPNTGRDMVENFIQFDPLVDSPKLDYRIDFPEVGTWYIWILGRGGKNDNSVHVGLFDEEIASASSIGVGTGSATEFGWTNKNGTKTRAAIDIEKTGIHTVNLWMREDGVEVDKMILTTDASFVPKASGPVESYRGTRPAAGK